MLKELRIEDSDKELNIGRHTLLGSRIETLYLGRNIPNLGSIIKVLSKLTIGGCVTTINDYAFENFFYLKELRFEDSDKELSIGSNSFSGCSIETLYLGRNIPNLSSINKPYLRKLTISGSVTSIDNSAFQGCCILASMTIPESVTTIGDSAFSGCSSLTSVTIPNSVTSIGDWAFSGCAGLNNFSFGSSMKEIGEEAFSDCIAMTNITSKATVPPVCGKQAMDDINKLNCTLTVPLSAVDSYKAADQWKEFFFITGEDFDNTSGVDNMVEDGGVSVTTNRDCIEIIGADNAVITVYNINGQLVYSGTETTVSGLAQGIYIVCVDGQTFKVAL